MKISVKIARFPYIDEIINFFDRNLDADNDAVYNEEFFCKFGIKKAIREKNIAIAVIDREIIGAVRFYPRKNDSIISFYQFAVDEKYRGKGVMHLILNFFDDKPIESLCPINSEFNNYYLKTGWELNLENDNFCVWRYIGKIVN